MRSERRKDLATGTVGAGMLAGGGMLRHAGVKRALAPGQAFPAIHPTALARKGAKGRRMYVGGTVLGLAGLPALALGATGGASRKVEKRAKDEPGFWREGLGGATEALSQRADTLREPVSHKVRAQQLGAGVAAGGLGSLAARAALGRKGDVLKPALTPIAGGLAGVGSLPVSSKIIERKHPEYQVTPFGVRRRKSVPKKPSSKASVVSSRGGSIRSQIVPSDVRKAEDYLGSRTGYKTQRVAVTAAGHPPIVGPITAAMAAGKYAPPGQERKHALRQYGMGSAAPMAFGVGGAYAGARAASNSSAAAGVAQDAMKAKYKLEQGARGMVGLKKKPMKPWAAPAQGSLRSSKALKPLFKSPARATGAAAGFLGAKMAAGGVLGQTAITLNQRDQSRYNKKRGISKGFETGKTKRETHVLATQKRRSAVLSTTGGLAGLTSLGLLAAGKKNAAINAGIIGSGLGGTNSLILGGVQRKEAQKIDPIKKRDLTEDGRAFQRRKRETKAWVKADEARRGAESAKQKADLEVFTGHLRAQGMKKPVQRPRTLDARKRQALARVAAMDETARQRYFATAAGKKWLRRNKVGVTGTYRWGPDVPKNMVSAQWRQKAGFGLQRKKGSTGYAGTGKPYGRTDVLKADLEIRYKGEHKRLLSQYGDRGALPKNLDRTERMKAYEARFAAHGGRKINSYARRAEVGEGVKNIGLGVATLGGAGYLGAKTKVGARLARKMPRAKSTADNIAIGGGVAGGAGEIYSGYANQRQSSYTNTPGGVAASALRRMRAYQPED